MDARKLFVFHWNFFDKKIGNEIHAYCISQNGDRVLLRTIGFKPFCYVENPSREDVEALLRPCHHYSWNNTYKPSTECVSDIKRFGRADFNTLDHMNRFKSIANRRQLRIHMTELDPISTFLALFHLERTGWLDIDASANGSAGVTVNLLTHPKAIQMSSIEMAAPIPRITCIDIECNSSLGGMPKVYIPEDRIEMISIVTQSGPTRRKSLVYLSKVEPMTRHVDIEGCAIPCDSEWHLIQEFVRELKEHDPDVITGFNIFGFDYQYILKRLSLVLKSLPNVSRYPEVESQGKAHFKKVEWESAAYGENLYYKLECLGRVSIDTMLIFKRFKLEKHSLDFVSIKFLGEGKESMNPQEMFKSFRTGEGYSKVASYCLKDSELVLRLFDKFLFWQELCEVSRAMGCSIDDIHTRGEQMKIVNQLIRECLDRDIVLSNRTTEKITEKYMGAFVLEPNGGLHDNCSILDFQSLYPSVMIAFNICPSTYVKSYTDYRLPTQNTDALYTGVFKTIGSGNLPENHISIPNKNAKNVHVYQTKERGILPGLAEKLLSKRQVVKSRIAKISNKREELYTMLDKRQYALKVAANSIYGAMGAKESKYFYHLQSAESITGIGRRLLVSLSGAIQEEHGVQVLYGDTDSCMVKCSVEEAKGIVRDINSRLPNPISLNFESFYDRILLIEKKKYILYRIAGDFVSYKGVMCARRGSCQYAKDFYSKVVGAIMRSRSWESPEVYDAIRGMCVKLFQGKISKADLIRTVSIQRLESYKAAPPHVVMALRLQHKGVTIEPGMRLEYMYTDPTYERGGEVPYLDHRKNKEETRLARRTTGLLEWDDAVHSLDKGCYLEREIEKPINSLLEAIGWATFDFKGIKE